MIPCTILQCILIFWSNFITNYCLPAFLSELEHALIRQIFTASIFPINNILIDENSCLFQQVPAIIILQYSIARYFKVKDSLFFHLALFHNQIKSEKMFNLNNQALWISIWLLWPRLYYQLLMKPTPETHWFTKSSKHIVFEALICALSRTSEPSNVWRFFTLLPLLNITGKFNMYVPFQHQCRYID